MILEKKNINDEIHTQKITNTTSQIATFPHIHKTLLHRQHTFHKLPNLITDNHDIKTIIFPNTPIKIFLNTSSKKHTHRRILQLQKKNFNINFKHLLTEIKKHDDHDRNRTITPLIPTTDTLILNSTTLNIKQIIKKTLQYTHQKLTLT